MALIYIMCMVRQKVLWLFLPSYFGRVSIVLALTPVFEKLVTN